VDKSRGVNVLGEVQTGQPNEKLKGRTSAGRGLYVIWPGLLTTGCSAWKRSETSTEANAVTSAKLIVVYRSAQYVQPRVVASALISYQLRVESREVARLCQRLIFSQSAFNDSLLLL